MNIFRKLMCKLSLCGGHIEHEKDKDGVWWIGLRCATCKKLRCPLKSHYQDLQPETKAP